MCSRRKLFRHDRRRDERYAVNRRRNVAQCVDLLIRRNEISRLTDKGYADSLRLRQKFIGRKRGVISPDGFKLIDGAARMTEPAPGHLGAYNPRTRRNRENSKRCLISDASRRMLIGTVRSEARKVDPFTGIKHCSCQGHRFFMAHSAKHCRHEKCRHLIIRDRTFREAVGQKAYLVVGQFSAETFFLDEIVHSHSPSPPFSSLSSANASGRSSPRVSSRSDDPETSMTLKSAPQNSDIT